jgi:hypothetical protein
VAIIRVLLALGLALQATTTTLNESLWEAARAGDTGRIAALLEQGVDVNAKTPYGMTALYYAADKGHLEAIKLLVARGADVNVEDSFYHNRPVALALYSEHPDIAAFLLEHGATEADAVLLQAVEIDNIAVVKATLAAGVSHERLQMALAMAGARKRTAVAPVIKAALDARPPQPSRAVGVPASTLAKYAGSYSDPGKGIAARASVRDDRLEVSIAGRPPIRLIPLSDTTFHADGRCIASTRRWDESCGSAPPSSACRRSSAT